MLEGQLWSGFIE
ncbi:unnamed protein product, partial [Allacma fusca]